MARYRKVDVRIWGDAFFRGLTPIPPCGAGLWFYLLTGEETGIIPGLFRAGEAGMAEALGWPAEAFREAFGEVSRDGKAKADWKARLVWVPNALKHNAPASPNVVRSWRDAWDELPECSLKSEAWRALRSFCEGLGEGFAKAFREACSEPSRKTLANQEQEQDQEQEVAAERGAPREKSPEPAKHKPAKEAAARVNAAEPEGSAPAAQHDGEAAAGGIPAETRGAAGPGHLRAVPATDDATELGPLGAEWRGRLEREIGKGLAVASAAEAGSVRAELEQLLERPHHGGVERALAWTVTTLAARRRSKAPEPGSVRYLLPLLREMPPIEVGAFDRARRECPEWAAVLDAAMSLPRGNAPTEHQLEDVLLRLRATFLRGELHLEAADENRRGLVEAFWLEGLTRLAQETIGAHVLVHLTAAAAPAAREA